MITKTKTTNRIQSVQQLMAERDALRVALAAVLVYMPDNTAFQRARIRQAEVALARETAQATAEGLTL